MTTETSREPASAQGFVHTKIWIDLVLAYFEARAGLLTLEAKEAAIQGVRVVAFAIVGLVLLVFGYFLFIIGLAFALNLFFDVGWITLLFGLAMLHLAGALACLLVVKVKLRGRLFSATLAELKNDRLWLRQLKP